VRHRPLSGYIAAALLALVFTGAVQINAARATGGIAHLEWLPLISSSACSISATCPAVSNGNRVGRGLRIDSTSHATIRLDGRWSTVYGTLYFDDSSESNAALEVSFVDVSATAQQTLLQLQVTRSTGGVPFAFSVRGVKDLLINPPSYYHGVLDLVGSAASDQPAPQPAHPASSRPAVVPISPTGNTFEPFDSRVLFDWHPFAGADNYALQLWLTKRAGSAALWHATPLTFSATVHGATLYAWNDHGFPQGEYDYRLLPLDGLGNPIGDWSTPAHFTIVQ